MAAELGWDDAQVERELEAGGRWRVPRGWFRTVAPCRCPGTNLRSRRPLPGAAPEEAA